jgi:hypothetical protein
MRYSAIPSLTHFLSTDTGSNQMFYLFHINVTRLVQIIVPLRSRRDASRFHYAALISLMSLLLFAIAKNGRMQIALKTFQRPVARSTLEGKKNHFLPA